MTVSSTANRVVYNGNGATTAWPFAFKVNAAADLVVIYTDATGTDFTLSSSQYGVTGLGLDAGGTVTYPTSGDPIASGTKLTIYRDVAVTQPASISNQGAMWPSVIEAALDRCIMIIQRIADATSRSLRVSPTDSSSLNELPNAAARANSVLGFDADGQPYAAVIGSGFAAASTWLVANFFPKTTRAEALAALGGAGTADDNTFAGANSFTVSPTVPTPTPGDNTTKPATTAFVQAAITAVAVPGRQIFGWTFANNATDATNDIDIAAGGGVDDTGAHPMAGAAMTKRLDAAWAAGTAAGGLDTGTISNNDYLIYAIGGAGKAVDYVFTIAGNAITYPDGYTYKRAIGWFKRTGGAISAFHVYETEGGGIDLLWHTPALEVDTETVGTSRTTYALRLPLNFSVLALINAQHNGSNAACDILCPDQADTAVALNAAPLGNMGASVAVSVTLTAGSQSISSQSGSVSTQRQLEVRTDATGKVAVRASASTVIYISTVGFRWGRR